mmetsp:Transcript_62066/g.164876  ORF Transcript_62066/g.164876 Transcript_62066/m.164876 type:complete len:215 (-) Transcript_62066:3858-4502(-)
MHQHVYTSRSWKKRKQIVHPQVGHRLWISSAISSTKSEKIICTIWFLTNLTSLLMSCQLASSMQISSSIREVMFSSMFDTSISWLFSSPALDPKRTTSCKRLLARAQVFFGSPWPSACCALNRARGCSPKTGRRQPSFLGSGLGSSPETSTRASASSRVQPSVSLSRVAFASKFSSFLLELSFCICSSTLGNQLSSGPDSVVATLSSSDPPRTF